MMKSFADIDKKHWTYTSTNGFQFCVAYDFIIQIDEKLEELGISDKQFAKEVGLSKRKFNKILKDPEKLTLKMMIQWAENLDLHLTVIIYDENKTHGPIKPDIFLNCWKKVGSPKDNWELQESANKWCQPENKNTCKECELTLCKNNMNKKLKEELEE